MYHILIIDFDIVLNEAIETCHYGWDYFKSMNVHSPRAPMFTVMCVCMCAVLCVVHAWSVMYVLCVCCVHVCVCFLCAVCVLCASVCVCVFCVCTSTSVMMPSRWSIEGYAHPPHCHCTSDL